MTTIYKLDGEVDGINVVIGIRNETTCRKGRTGERIYFAGTYKFFEKSALESVALGSTK